MIVEVCGLDLLTLILKKCFFYIIVIVYYVLTLVLRCIIKQLFFTQEIPPGGALSGLGRGGVAGERGRGRGRGFFDRHRSQVDDEDGVGRREEGGGRGFGRGT